MRHAKPSYEPVHGHYVNPPGTRPLSPWVMAVVGIVVLLVAAGGAALLIMNFEPTAPRTPSPEWVTPGTYGPPPATTGAGR